MPRRYPNTEFARINEGYFGNRLPKYRVLWKPDEKMSALLGCMFPLGPKEIWLNSRYKNASRIWLLTLIHEMAHVEQYMIAPLSKSHGRVWIRIMKRLAAEGAFDDCW